MKNTFKAAVLYKLKSKLKIVNLQFPKKLYKGQVLVKLISAAICGAQIGEIKGIKGEDKWLPHCMGHEGFGIIVGKHKSVKKLKLKDKVIMHWRKSNGINAKTYKYYDINNKVINSGNITTFQDYSVTSENRLTKVNNFNENKIGPLLGCAIPTAWGILVKETKFETKNNLLIFGAGGVGITIALLAKIMGAKNVYLVDKFIHKKKLLKKLKLNFMNLKYFKKNKLKKFDRVIDTTGSTKIISQGFNRVKKNGYLVLVGQPKKNSTLKLYDPIKLFNPPSDNIKIISSDGGLFNPDIDLKKILKIVKKNKKIFTDLITHSLKLNDINKGIDLIKKGKAGRIGINFFNVVK